MQCDMRKDCPDPVTHISSKGYIYCTEHAIDRRQGGYERTRRMRAWELKMVASDQPLPSYDPISLAAVRLQAVAAEVTR